MRSRCAQVDGGLGIATAAVSQCGEFSRIVIREEDVVVLEFKARRAHGTCPRECRERAPFDRQRRRRVGHRGAEQSGRQRCGVAGHHHRRGRQAFTIGEFQAVEPAIAQVQALHVRLVAQLDAA